MGFYIGIDLGTTNSAIAIFDGKNTKVLRDPENNDVTPSAIYIDSRGTKFYGRKAYDFASGHDKDVALSFKRFIGTNMDYHFESSGEHLTPIECSTEILRVLRSYLQQVGTGKKKELGTIITVPAAFNQVQKAATHEAALAAGFYKVELMQEPVAAIMSIMQTGNIDGYFLVYDLGGGTFDISIAENIEGNVSLRYQGGKPVCGGKDWDWLIFDKIINPWLHDKFDLPDDYLSDERFMCLYSIGIYAAEKAKIALSTQEKTLIYMDVKEIGCNDLSGDGIFLDVPISRFDLDKLIESMVDETIAFAKSMMADISLSAEDIEKIVFIGGPTKYKPLREKVSDALNILADTSVDPMTAVAVGASIFAEAIDWTSDAYKRKPTSAAIEIGDMIKLNYESRTPKEEACLTFITDVPGSYTAEVRSADTGWTSGNIPLKSKRTEMVLPLNQNGINMFNVIFHDSDGSYSRPGEHVVEITRTYGNMSSVAASHSVMLEVLDKANGNPEAIYLVKKGDALPSKGEVKLRSGIELESGFYNDLRFHIRGGEIKENVRENEYIGTYKICGIDFDGGDIQIGSEIICDYEVSDSGNLILSTSVPDIRADFGQKNYYCFQDAIIDLDMESDRIVEKSRILLSKINSLPKSIVDKRLSYAKQKLIDAASIEVMPDDSDRQDKILHARSALIESGNIFANVLDTHHKEMRQSELDDSILRFNVKARVHAEPAEVEKFDSMAAAAQLAIARNELGFENRLDEMSSLRFRILWRQDWYVIELFNLYALSSESCADKELFSELKQKGIELKRNDQIDELRFLVFTFSKIMRSDTAIEEPVSVANVVRG